ncbi:hypothetical protein N7527_011875 [Penicillium freii]|nr:hypothetical protein N7527_011875 [Penicillium freii]
MSTAPTTVFRTLVVHEPSAPHLLIPRPPPSPAAVVSGIVWFVYITNKKEEEKGEEGNKPNETEGIPLDTWTVAAAMTPQATLNLQWLRESQAAGKLRLKSLIIAPMPYLTGDEVKFIPVPPGYDLPPCSRPKKRDPAAVSANTSTARNVTHGAKEMFRFASDPAVAPAA